MASRLRESAKEASIAIQYDKENREVKEYTKMFFQRPLSFGQAAAWVFFHYMTVAIVQGYFHSVQFSLQANGATYKDQSKLSLALYPYSFKFLFSPLLDRYFFSNFGRSKTYIIGGGLIITGIFCFLGEAVQRMVQQVQITEITILFAVVHFMACVVQIAGEAWILTMFHGDDKAKASTYLHIGMILGVMLGYNIFTPLNDVDWLNQNIFSSNPLDKPILSHQLFCFIVAGMYLAQIIINVLFIAEEKITDNKAKDLVKILAVLPRHATNPHMRKFILYMFACKFIYFMLDFTLDFKLARNGYLNIGRSMISNIDMMVFPLVFILSYLTVYYMQRGKLVRLFHMNMAVVVFVGVFRFLTYQDLVENRSYSRVIAARIISGILQGMDFCDYFF